MSRQYKRFTISDAFRYRRQQTQSRQRLLNDSIDRIKKAIGHSKSKRIRYKDYKKAYNYVQDLFSDVPIKDVEVFRCQSSHLKKIGLGGIGGCFSCPLKVIVIADDYKHQESTDDIWGTVKGSATIDEVIVHELLHYVSLYKGGRALSMEMEEEFAYKNSIEYLRGKGYSDDEIVNNNFLPYFMSIVDTKEIVAEIFAVHGYGLDKLRSMSNNELRGLVVKYDEEIFHATKKAAVEKSMDLIRMFDCKGIPKPKGIGCFDLLDLD